MFGNDAVKNIFINSTFSLIQLKHSFEKIILIIRHNIHKKTHGKLKKTIISRLYIPQMKPLRNSLIRILDILIIIIIACTIRYKCIVRHVHIENIEAKLTELEARYSTRKHPVKFWMTAKKLDGSCFCNSMLIMTDEYAFQLMSEETNKNKDFEDAAKHKIETNAELRYPHNDENRKEYIRLKYTQNDEKHPSWRNRLRYVGMSLTHYEE